MGCAPRSVPQALSSLMKWRKSMRDSAEIAACASMNVPLKPFPWKGEAADQRPEGPPRRRPDLHLHTHRIRYRKCRPRFNKPAFNRTAGGMVFWIGFLIIWGVLPIRAGARDAAGEKAVARAVVEAEAVAERGGGHKGIFLRAGVDSRQWNLISGCLP